MRPLSPCPLAASTTPSSQPSSPTPIGSSAALPCSCSRQGSSAAGQHVQGLEGALRSGTTANQGDLSLSRALRTPARRPSALSASVAVVHAHEVSTRRAGEGGGDARSAAVQDTVHQGLWRDLLD